MLAVGLGAAIAVLPTSMTIGLIVVLSALLSVLLTPYAALVLLLVCAPLRALIDVRSPGLLPLDVGQIGLAVLAGAWLLDRAASGRPFLREVTTSAMLAVGGFVAAGALSGFGAASLGVWLNDWLKWVFVLALVAWIVSSGRWEYAIFALALAGIANALVGIWIYFGGSGAAHFLIDASHYRAFGTFEQPNPFGGFMGMLAPLFGAVAFGFFRLTALRWSLDLKSAWKPLFQSAFYSVAFVLTSLALVLSWSRGAWLAFGVAAVVTVISIPRRAWVRIVLILLMAGITILALVSGRLPTTVTERIGSAFSDLVNVNDVRGANISPENYAVLERLAHWQAALEMARLNPLTGVGLGNYEVIYPQVRLMAWPFPLGHAHNYYLNVLAEAGMIGLAAYGAMWIIMAALTWQARRHPDMVASAAAAGLLGSWAYIAVHSLTDQLYVNYAFLHVGVMMGVAALLYAHTWKPNRLKPL